MIACFFAVIQIQVWGLDSSSVINVMDKIRKIEAWKYCILYVFKSSQVFINVIQKSYGLLSNEQVGKNKGILIQKLIRIVAFKNRNLETPNSQFMIMSVFYFSSVNSI